MKYTLPNIIIVALICSLTILIIAILYRKLIRHYNKNTPNKEDYCVLYSLETPTEARNEIEIYFTIDKPKHVKINLLDSKMQFLALIKEGDFTIGGHIVRFDTTTISNGVYFYSLQTDNQHTMKKMSVRNV